jgi:hypothetical protein
MDNRYSKTSIHTLDDDSLLNIFYFCRPALLDEDEVDPGQILRGGNWVRERWWYTLVQVCRRWQYRVLASASYLGLSLRCTCRTPVADMLAHSPPLPLVIDYISQDCDIEAEEEEGIMLALQHQGRVRRIRLSMPMPISKLQKLISAIDGEFPMLEYLYVASEVKHDSGLTLPTTILAPNLRHLVLKDFAFPIGPPLLKTAPGLVTLSLMDIHSSDSFIHPNDLLQQISLLPQLETLGISVHSPVPSSDVEMQLMDAPIKSHATLHNLRWFAFGGASAYLEALLPSMAMPLLERLQIWFLHQSNFSVPCLLQFMDAAQNFRFGSAKFHFSDQFLDAFVYPYEDTAMYNFNLEIPCRYLRPKIVSATQIFHALRPVISGVEHLTLESSCVERMKRRNGAYRQWREFLGLFGNVKTLRVEKDYLRQISGTLRIGGGGSHTELLPELKKLELNASRVVGNSFDTFIDARKNAGHPVVLVGY